jgi:hypothetical protein
VSSCCLGWGIVSILVLTTCMCGCLSSGFLGLGEFPYFLSFLLGFSRVNSTGVISVSNNASTGEMFAWNTSIDSLDLLDLLLVRRWFFLTICMSREYRGSLM